MCGIAGFLDKTRGDSYQPVGGVLVSILKGLASRGPDSAGIAFFTRAVGQATLRIKLFGRSEGQVRRLRQLLDQSHTDRYQLSIEHDSVRVVINDEKDLCGLAAGIESI